MKTKPSVLAASIAALLAPLALGQDLKIWDGGASPDGTWSNGLNWSDDLAPDGNDVLNFAGTLNLTTTNDLVGGALNQYRIFFNAGAGNFTLGGAGLTLFDFGGNAPKVENNAVGSTQTINLPLTLNGTAGGGFAEINPVNGNLTFGATGTVDLAGTTQLRIWGDNGNTVTFGGAISSSGNGGLNQVAINQNSTVVFNAANTYAGDTFINAGTLRFGAAGSANASTLRLGDTGGTAAARLELTGGSTLGSPLQIRPGSTGLKTIQSTTGTNALNGSVAVDADAVVQVNAGTLTLGGALSGTGALAIQGNGTTVFGVDNSLYAGNVTVDSTAGGALSTLRLAASNALVTGTVTVNSSTTLVGGNGTTLEIGGGVTIGSGVTAVFNTSNVGGSRRTTLLGSGTSTFNGAITANGNDLAQFTANTGANFTIGGNIAAPTFTGTLFFRGAGTGTFTGSVNAPTGTFNKTDAGTWTVSSPTLNVGAFQVSDGVLKAGRVDLLPAGVTLTIGQPSATSGAFDLNGFNQTVTGLVVSTGSTGTNNRVTNTGVGTPTFTVNNTSNFTYSGLLAGNLNLSKTGNGTLVLSGGTSTFVGSPAGSAVSITGGVLQVSTNAQLGADANGVFLDNNATLRGAPTANLVLAAGRQFTIGAGGATFDVSTNFNFGPAATADRLTGSGPITKTGIGNFRVQGGNATLSSNWTVLQGVVEANAATALGSGTVTINSSALVALQNGPYANSVFLAGGGIGSVNADNTLSGPLDVVGGGFIYLNDWFQDTTRGFTLGGVVTMDAGETLTVGLSRIGSTNTAGLLLRNEANVLNGTIVVNQGLRVETSANDLSGKTTSNATFTLAGGGLYLKDNNDGVSNASLAYGNHVVVTNASGGGQSQFFAIDGGVNVSELDVNRVDGTGAVTNNTFQLGTLTMGAQTLRVRGANGYAAEFTGTTTLTGNATLETTTANLTLSGVVNGAVALTKSGAGTLALGGAGGTALNLTSLTVNPGGIFQLNNTVTDVANRLSDTMPIVLSAGTLALRGNPVVGSSETVGPVTIGAGAGLSASSPAPITANTTLTLAALTRANAAATLSLTSSGTGTLGAADKILVASGAPANNPAGIVGGWGVNVTDLDFVGYDGPTGFTSRAFTQTTLTGAGSNDLVNRTAAQALTGNVEVSAARLGAGAITGAFTVNLNSGGLILNNGGTGVTHSSNFSFSPDGITRGPAYLYVNNTDGAATVAGTVTTIFSGLLSASEVVKNGPGNLRLSNTGQSVNAGLAGALFTINGGSLEIGDRTGTSSAGRGLPATARIQLNVGSVNFFDNTTIAGLNGLVGTTVRLGSSISGDTARTLTINNNVDNAFYGTFTSDDNNVGDAGLAKGGTGKLILGGVVQNGRTTTVNMGELVLTETAQMNGTVSDRQRIIINQGGAFTLDNTLANLNDRINLNAGTTNGGGYLQMNGGTFTLLGHPNVNTTETFGTATALAANNDPFFGLGMNVINIVPGAGRAAILVSERAILRNPGATVLYQGANFGGTRGAADTASFNYNTAAPAMVGGGASGSALASVFAGVFVNSIISGVDTYGIGTIAGTGTTVAGVRRLVPGEQTTTLANGATALHNIFLNGAAITGIDAATTVNSLHLAGSSIAGAGTLTVNSGTILAANNGTVGANALTVAGLAFGTREAAFFTADDLAVSSVITGTAGLTKGGAGKLTLSGANTFDASAAPLNANGTASVLGVTVNGGLLSISSNGNLGAATNLLRLNNGGGLQTTASASLARDVVLGNAGGVIEVAGAGNTTTISGSISGSLGAVNTFGIAAGTGTPVSTTSVLMKTGAGKLLLTGANTYTGLTQVNNGTLLVGDGVSGSLPANSFVAVNSGGTLGGSGTIGGGVTVHGGGTLAPGNSTGLFSVGALTMNVGSTLALELNSTTPAAGYDQVSASSVSLTGGAVSLSLGFDPVDGLDVFYVILNNGAAPVSGTFAGLPEGATFLQGGQQFQITYTANWTGTQAGSSPTGGNDVALLAVPEPSAAAVLLAGVALLGLRRRRG